MIAGATIGVPIGETRSNQGKGSTFLFLGSGSGCAEKKNPDQAGQKTTDPVRSGSSSLVLMP